MVSGAAGRAVLPHISFRLFCLPQITAPSARYKQQNKSESASSPIGSGVVVHGDVLVANGRAGDLRYGDVFANKPVRSSGSFLFPVFCDRMGDLSTLITHSHPSCIDRSIDDLVSTSCCGPRD
jgi:hypothetical protein